MSIWEISAARLCFCGIFVLANGRIGKECECMAKERFVEVYSQGIVNVAKIIVDTETGVNYLLGSHNKQAGTGLTVLVDQNGKPIVTPIE